MNAVIELFVESLWYSVFRENTEHANHGGHHGGDHGHGHGSGGDHHGHHSHTHH